MSLAGVHAGGKGIHPLNAVRKPLIHQKIQGAVGHRGLVAKPFGSKALQHLIGTQSAVILQQNLQHPPADRGQPYPLRLGKGLGPLHYIAGTMRMVMARKGQIGGRAAKAIMGVIMRQEEGS